MACVIGLVVVLWQLVAVTTPFRPAYAQQGCSAALIDAFGDGGAKTLTEDQWIRQQLEAAKDGKEATIIETSSCRQPSRHRLWRAGALVLAAGAGTLGAVRILRHPVP